MDLLTARGAALLRTGWGVVLLAAPSLVLRAARAPSRNGAPVVIARVLGARQAGQGLLTWRSPSPTLLRVGALADGLHGASAVGLAWYDRRWRRAGLVEAVLAAALMRAGLAAASDDTPPGDAVRTMRAATALRP